MVRVIAGEAKGRRLVTPQLPGLRPTSDRVREAIFDILEARGLVEGAVVLDLFSGCGALGIEALSRGAAAVTFVEHDRRAMLAIERNLGISGFRSRPGVRVVRAEVLEFLSGEGRSPVDLVLADPPYAFEAWGELLGRLRAPTVLVEHRSPLGPTGSYAVSRAYRYGGTLVTLLQATPGASANPGERAVGWHKAAVVAATGVAPSAAAHDPDKDTDS